MKDDSYTSLPIEFTSAMHASEAYWKISDIDVGENMVVWLRQVPPHAGSPGSIPSASRKKR